MALPKEILNWPVNAPYETQTFHDDMVVGGYNPSGTVPGKKQRKFKLSQLLTFFFKSLEVENIAALRLITGKRHGQIAIVQGYYSRGDGGGGPDRYWDAYSTATDNGGSVIKPTSVTGAGRWVYAINGIINVKNFGAIGDGIYDNFYILYTCFIYAINNNYDVSFSPEVYYISTPLPLNGNNTKIFGNGATIDCRGINAGTIPGMGTGGGIGITGDNNIIDGLNFIGYSVSVESLDYVYGRLILITGNKNKIINCNFEEGNGCAVKIYGDDNIVENNNFNRCNYFESSGDYGSIHISTGVRNRILYNNIVNQYYSGVSSNGSSVDGIEIIGNNIRSIYQQGDADHSMGLFLINGSASNSIISKNHIENVSAECILLASSSGAAVNNVVISDNYLSSFDYAGISLQNAFSPSGIIITNNVIYENTYIPTAFIRLDTLQNSIVQSNICIGADDGALFGIYMAGSSNNNLINNNVISGVDTGILYAGRGNCQGNHVSNCGTGISYAFCPYASISNNNVDNCDTLYSAGTSGNAFLSGNAGSNATNIVNTGQRQIFPSYKASDQQSTWKATLVNGEVNVNTGNIKSGDVFFAFPVSGSTTATGIITIGATNITTGIVTIISSDSLDDRDVILVRAIMGDAAG